MFEIVILLIFVVLFIVPTFYGMYRAAVTKQWGWFGGIIVGWLVGFGWVVGWIFLLADRKRQS